MSHDHEESPSGSTNGHDPFVRPSGACVTCPPPQGRAWTLADPRHSTCSGCYDRLRDRIAEIAERYLLLDARPGSSFELGGRGAPGYASRPPASMHVIAMRDPRSSQDARMWVAGDGRVHAEQTRPARSVHGALSLLAWTIAEHRGVDGPGDRDDVYALLRFVDRHLDHVTRHAELAVDADRTLRDLAGALRPVTGDGRRPIGPCPNEVYRDGQIEAYGDAANEASDEPLSGADGLAGVVVCEAMLYAPLHGDVVACGSCGASWAMHEWLDLGSAITAEQALPAVRRAS